MDAVASLIHLGDWLAALQVGLPITPLQIEKLLSIVHNFDKLKVGLIQFLTTRHVNVNGVGDIQINETTTVSQLKKQLASRLGIPATGQLILSEANNILSDTTLIYPKYNVLTLQLIPRTVPITLDGQEMTLDLNEASTFGDLTKLVGSQKVWQVGETYTAKDTDLIYPMWQYVGGSIHGTSV